MTDILWVIIGAIAGTIIAFALFALIVAPLIRLARVARNSRQLSAGTNDGAIEELGGLGAGGPLLPWRIS